MQLPKGKGCTSWHFKGADLFPSGQAHGLCHIPPGKLFSRPSHTMHGSMPIGSLCRGAACMPVCAWMHTCVCKGMLLLPLPVVRQLFLCPSQVTFSFLFISFLPLFSYGRVYTADPYHALAPAASYGVGAVVSGIFFCFSFPARGTATGYRAMKPHPEKCLCWGRRSLATVVGSQLFRILIYVWSKKGTRL